MTSSVNRSGIIPESFPGGKDRKRKGRRTPLSTKSKTSRSVTRGAALIGIGATA